MTTVPEVPVFESMQWGNSNCVPLISYLRQCQAKNVTLALHALNRRLTVQINRYWTVDQTTTVDQKYKFDETSWARLPIAELIEWMVKKSCDKTSSTSLTKGGAFEVYIQANPLQFRLLQDVTVENHPFFSQVEDIGEKWYEVQTSLQTPSADERGDLPRFSSTGSHALEPRKKL